jgi:EmrB/QacA subfamily drug resistance transporter
MLAVALPRVMAEFSIDPSTVSTLVTLYLGAVTLALPASGSLGDRFGQRRVFLVGVVAFAVASLLAAVAPSFELLAVARVLQAVSGALVSTTSVGLVRAMSGPERLGTTFGAFDGLTSVAAAIAPFIGGVLVGAFGWRSLFFIAVPVALFAAVTVGLAAPPDRQRGDAPGREGLLPAATRPRPFDLPGLGLLAATLIALLVAIRGAGDGGLGTLAAIVVLPLLLLFLRFELASDHPAVDPRLFAIRPFAAAVLGVMGATVVLHGAFFLVPLLVENLQGETAQVAGLVLLAISALWAVAAPIGGRLSDRRGRRLPVVAGSILVTAGLVALWWFAAASTAAVVALLLAVVGLGLGLSGSPRQAAAFDRIPPERVGMAAGTYYTGRYLGGVLGASLAGAVLGSSVTGAGVSLGFGLLAIVGVAIIAISFGLPDRPSRRAEASA